MTEGIHQDQAVDDSKSPGQPFSSLYQSMQDLFEKLSVLKYSQKFCQEYKCKPIHR